MCLTFRLKSALKVTPSLKNRYEIIIKSCSAKMNGSLIQTSYLTLKLGVFHQSFIRNIDDLSRNSIARERLVMSFYGHEAGANFPECKTKCLSKLVHTFRLLEIFGSLLVIPLYQLFNFQTSVVKC